MKERKRAAKLSKKRKKPEKTDVRAVTQKESKTQQYLGSISDYLRGHD